MAASMQQDKIILVVDDQEISRVGVSLVLSSLGYKVQDAASGELALEKLRVQTFAAILLDCYMPPGMTGMRCAELIRASEKKSLQRVPIIAFSSENQPGIKQLCLDAGMDCFLEKSCSNEKLNETLQALIGPTSQAIPGESV